MEEADRDGGGAGARHLLGHGGHLGGVGCEQDLAVAVDALAHLEGPVPGHGGRGSPEEEVEAVVLLPELATERRHVAEPRRGHEGQLAAGALQDDVGRERRAVHQAHHLGGIHVLGPEHLGDAQGHALTRIVGGRGHLGDRHTTVGVAEHDVGERAPDVHAEEAAPRPRLHPPAPEAASPPGSGSSDP